MKKEIKINKLCGWSTLISNVLRDISTFNNGYAEYDIDFFETYVKKYDEYVPKGIFNYITKRERNTLVIFMDDELALSITMCEMNELVNNENY